jgi:hypothetical protein
MTRAGNLASSRGQPLRRLRLTLFRKHNKGPPGIFTHRRSAPLRHSFNIPGIGSKHPRYSTVASDTLLRFVVAGCDQRKEVRKMGSRSVPGEKRRHALTALEALKDPEDDLTPLEERIRLRAYQIFVDRGGLHGSDTDDWLRAEAEILAAEEEQR